MVITCGPSVWKVPGSDGLVLAAAPFVGSPSISPVLSFRFPKACFVAGVLALLRDPTPSAMGHVALRILDEKQDPIINDSRGTLRGTTMAPVAAGLLMLHGKGFAPYAVQRPVNPSRIWTFTFQNEDTVATPTVAGLFLYFEKLRGAPQALDGCRL